MKKILIIIIVLTLLLGSTVYFLLPKQAPTTSLSMDGTHIGGAVFKTAQRDALNNVYSVKKEALTGYGDFDRTVTVYGLTLIVHKDIQDDFVDKIVATMKGMFPSVDDPKQEEILQNMYKYKAALPVVPSEDSVASMQEKLMKNFSLCDIIMKTDQQQANEVLEHLLHAITDVGLHYTYPETWGLSESKAAKEMQTSIDRKYYNISDYKDFPTSIKNRVLIQEYAYWVITAIWDTQKLYGSNGNEWTLNTREKLEADQPELLNLYNSTISHLMVKPDAKILDAFK